MFFGGLQKNSFIDYPGKLSCILFASGCNFECPYCHNPALVRGGFSRPPAIDEKTVFTYLEKRKGFLDGIVISGGEPTLQKDLVPVCEKIQKMGYPIKLDTNGSRPLVIKKLIEKGLVDYIAMDLKTDPSQYFPLISKVDSYRQISESIRIIMASDLPYEFRNLIIIDSDNLCLFLVGYRDNTIKKVTLAILL